jgi:hypothetical protein
MEVAECCRIKITEKHFRKKLNIIMGFMVVGERCPEMGINFLYVAEVRRFTSS